MSDEDINTEAAEAVQVAAQASNTTTDHLQLGELDTGEANQTMIHDEAGNLVRDRFLEFLDQFFVEFNNDNNDNDDDDENINDREDADNEQQRERIYVYREQATKLSRETGSTANTIVIDHEHIRTYDMELAEALDAEYVRFEAYACMAATGFVNSIIRNIGQEDGAVDQVYISIFNLPNVLPVREVRTDQVGRLSSIAGTVTRTSDVRPELLAGTFRCEECGMLAEHVRQEYRYTTPTICRNPQCSNISANKWMLEFDKSTFVDWQRLRVQENSDEIPPGSMPRSVDVIIRGDAVEGVKAGDKCLFTGMLVVIPDGSALARAGEAVQSRRGDDSGAGVRGLKALGVRELTYRTCFVASSAIPCDLLLKENNHLLAYINMLHNKRGAAMQSTLETNDSFSDAEMRKIQEMRSTPQLYNKIVNSIAPNTFGHIEVKRGVFLMLLGGVHKTTEEGIKLRGDINVCIVGDPSVAKSQFLKYVHGFSNRSVYTSGKASSAAGLTAAVVRDDDTGEYCIEAGALMLADEGVCCIDEFDKMDLHDQVAIHEAMEQQTISITKAGIQATLNARASILAAANPIYGRYDRSKTLKANVALSAPILSRFDLFFVILDECDELADYNVAKHILDVHRCEETAIDVAFTKQELQLYVRFARTFNPTITEESKKVLVECYRNLRQGDTLGRSRSAYRITVRQLESMIRLSEALARLHLDSSVKPNYVREAFRLLKKSIIHVETEDVTFEEEAAEFSTMPQVSDDDDINGATRNELHPGEYNGKNDVGIDDAVPKAEKVEPPKKKRKKKKKKTNITFEQYQSISNALAMHLRFIEDRSNTSEEEIPAYISRSDAVKWYLEQCEAEIGDSLEELERMKKLTDLVVQRLIEKDRVLVYIGDYPDSVPVDDRLIAVHPNFVIQ